MRRDIWIFVGAYGALFSAIVVQAILWPVTSPSDLTTRCIVNAVAGGVTGYAASWLQSRKPKEVE